MIKIVDKCSECVKSSVCKHAENYEYDCTHLPNHMYNETTELRISCSEFVSSAKTFKEAKK